MKNSNSDRTEEKRPTSFAQELNRQQRPGLLPELWEFLKYNKKWWLAPLIGLLLFIGALATLAGTAAAPFIYTLF